MAVGEYTVGELRKAIADMPDDSPILIKPNNQSDWLSHDRKRYREGGEVKIVEAKPARPWNGCPRLVYNVYQANDDHFEQNRILMIEIGEDSPL